jgi:hypothetical protein
MITLLLSLIAYSVGKLAKVASGKRSLDVYPVRSFDFQEAIQLKCSERNDLWGNVVLNRLSSALDLPAADAIYHQTCNVNFRTGKHIPKMFMDGEPSVKKSSGRPEDKDVQVAFQKVACYLEENVDVLIRLQDLVQVMSNSHGEKAYSGKHFKKKLKDHFRDSLIITSCEGKDDLISLKETASSILHTFYKTQRSESEEEQKHIIIETSAKLIQREICDVKVSKEYYPSFADVSSVDKNLNYVSDSLRLLLQHIFPENIAILQT